MSQQHSTTSTTTLARRPGTRRLVRAAVVAATAAGAVAIGAPAASAAATLGYHQVAVFPTWSWGATTTVCVFNPSSSSGTAKIRVTPTSNPSLYDDIYAAPGQTSCIKRSWWGAPIVANNLSYTVVSVSTR